MIKRVKENRWYHKIFAVVIASTMVFSSFSGIKLEAQAVATPEKMEVSTYKSGETWTAPTKEGQVFAGWYTDETCKTPYLETSGEAYAKFVDANVLSVKKQLRSGASHDSETTNVRFLTSVDTLNYESVGFLVSVVGTDGTTLNEFNLVEKSAYTTVLVDGVEDPATAKDTFCGESKYFVVHTITGVPNAAFDGGFTVTPYWYTLDGTKVEGKTSSFTIRNTIGVPDGEATNFDGIISNEEYPGVKLSSVSENGNYRIAVQGMLTAGGNIRLAVTVDAKTASDTEVNTFPGMSRYLFAEFGFGDNTGNGDCTLVKANVLGQTENAVMKGETKDNGESAEYRYTTEMELWIPQRAITNNTDPTNVKFTRAVLFNNDASGAIWHIARWVDLNNCTITADGIHMDSDVVLPEDETAGLDGIISAGEYKGEIVSKASANNKLSVQGHLTEGKNIRLAVTIDANTHPDTTVNGNNILGNYLFAGFYFGDGDGYSDDIWANVRGDSQNVLQTAVKTTDNGEGAAYRYTTVIEMLVSKSAIHNSSNEDDVRFARAVLYNATYGDIYLLAYFAGDLPKCGITANGIYYK